MAHIQTPERTARASMAASSGRASTAASSGRAEDMSLDDFDLDEEVDLNFWRDVLNSHSEGLPELLANQIDGNMEPVPVPSSGDPGSNAPGKQSADSKGAAGSSSSERHAGNMEIAPPSAGNPKAQPSQTPAPHGRLPISAEASQQDMYFDPTTNKAVITGVDLTIESNFFGCYWRNGNHSILAFPHVRDAPEMDYLAMLKDSTSQHNPRMTSDFVRLRVKLPPHLDRSKISFVGCIPQ